MRTITIRIHAEVQDDHDDQALAELLIQKAEARPGVRSAWGQ